MGGKLKAKTEKDGKRIVKALTKKQTRAKVDTETGIPGAGKQLEALQKDISALKKANSALTVTVGKLWKDKVERDMREDQE